MLINDVKIHGLTSFSGKMQSFISSFSSEEIWEVSNSLVTYMLSLQLV